MISIDEFRKVELKVATIKGAEPHPNADKLMVLQIDLGSEQRQICAGIRNHYAPEELIGRQIVVVANLETAKLRGLESQGMLLAASDEGRVILLTPEKAVRARLQGVLIVYAGTLKSIHGHYSTRDALPFASLISMPWVGTSARSAPRSDAKLKFSRWSRQTGTATARRPLPKF